MIVKPHIFRWIDPLGLNCGIKEAEVEEFIDPRSGRKKLTITLKNEKDLFQAYEIETADQKYFEDPGGNYWTSEDKTRRVEFSEGHEPSPHNPLGEGPHVKVMEQIQKPGSKKLGWDTTKKYRVKGHEHYKKAYF